jgi:2-phospho-L-lactate/phosphoenolpyruvate guanylyltransferase
MRSQPPSTELPRAASTTSAAETTAAGGRQHDAGVVVPIRSFRFGNRRLALVLDDEARTALARRMAETVIGAASTRPIVVVSSAPEVAQWCEQHRLPRLEDPGTLDAAAAAGRRWTLEQGLGRVVVVHGDLPFASNLDDVAAQGTAPVAVLVPDHRGDGTPVCSVPVDADFGYAYGPGSFARHVAAAARAGLTVRVVRDPNLQFDVDVPEDLIRLESPTP